MTTDSCERCGDSAPEALLRQIELRVDGSQVDEQTVCPDCFANWIAHYQEQMAGDMPGAAETTATGNESNQLSETVEAARERSAAESTEATTADVDAATGPSEATGGNEIREVGASNGGREPQSEPGAEETAEPTREVDVDLGGDADVAEEEDEDDDGGLLLG